MSLSVQWGVGVSSASGTTTLTYHLAYSNFAAVFTGNTSGDKSTSPVNMTNVGLSSCRIHVKDDARYYADSFNWFALGFQQWGYTGEQSNKITFALSYPKAVLGIMVTTGDGIPQNPVDVTLSGATAVGYNSAGCKTYWLAYGIQQWGVVAKSDTFGSYTFVLPVAVSNVLVATSAIKGWNNTANNLCWHCVGTTSGPNDIVVTWNCYDNRTRISYVGYIALCI